MLEILAFVVAVAVALIVLQGGAPWYVALGIGVGLWWVIGAFVWRVRRRRAQPALEASAAHVRRSLHTDVAIADPALNVFVAVDNARTRLIAGSLDGAPPATWHIADLSTARVEIDTGWGLVLDRERTPAGRLLTTLYYPFQPIAFVFALLSIFDAPGGDLDVFVRSKRVRAIRIVADTRGAPFDVTIYDERRSATYPGSAKPREAAAREVVAAVRRGIARASGGTIA
ncbi:hypothetical protein [Sphingomonas sp. Leaf37]|uniref:hypothetical protein n=1 Tax=Sphingomonas sp. Leaf37 TaxID=2876552 RepID=UPI001E2FBE3A|nr:hypothetical protein [Sphingomonas sp. Leaf37]